MLFVLLQHMIYKGHSTFSLKQKSEKMYHASKSKEKRRYKGTDRKEYIKTSEGKELESKIEDLEKPCFNRVEEHKDLGSKTV